MKPMEPMKGQDPWWPGDLGEPNSSGGQDDLHYAYFADRRRLAVSRGGKVTVYDTDQYRIDGVAQHDGGSDDPRFSSPQGDVALGSLEVVG